MEKNKIYIYKETLEIINLLGLLPIQYKGNMTIFNNKINDIKKNHPNYKDFIDKYSIKYKFKFFEL